jgi:hypothetical protein
MDKKNNFPGHARGGAIGFVIGNKGFIGTGADTLIYKDMWEYEIPSAEEMESSDGLALGKMNTQLLQKVEELTLYILKQQKEIDEMKKEIEKINK